MTEHHDVFLSYSHNDREAAIRLRRQLDQHRLSVFWDKDSIRAGDFWLDRLQGAVDACASFVVLVGRDGVRRWVGAETQAALNRCFSPHDDTQRLPIFPILLDGAKPETLPAFLQLFQSTPWNGVDPLPEQLLQQIRKRTIVADETIRFEGCPFVGLAAYRIDQAHLFFGRQKETLDALACFDTRRGSQTVRWLEINGNSGSGKSSLMNAGLLPLVEQGWLWPHTEFERWRRIGPMMPGEHPVDMLAEHLARAFGVEMADISQRLAANDRALAQWLRSRKQDETAFLLAIDQFEELFTFVNPEQRGQFDRLLAGALTDAECPLFMISTVRADFLDRFEDLPRLVDVRNRLGKAWTLPLISAEGLREVIGGPARLADLDVSTVQETMVTEARDEPGALPLVENALHWLWQHRAGNRLSGQQLTDMGGLAGILSYSADSLLQNLDGRQRTRALELLFRLVKVDPERRRHTRWRIPLAEAVAVAGGGEHGLALVHRLAGARTRDGGRTQGPLRLITITEEATSGTAADRWVNLIHETLIRSKGPDAEGKPQPYWPTLWSYIEQHKGRAARRERLALLAQEWKGRTGVRRFFGLAGWSELFGFRGLAAPKSIEQRYLRWSTAKALVQAIVLATILGVVGESLYWAMKRGLPLEVLTERWAYKLGKKLPFPHLVEIPAGPFMMGGTRFSDEQPIHLVTFTQPFYLGRTEVTFREWDACVADGDCKGYRPAAEEWGRDDRPVINVNWEDAQAYVLWLSRKTGSTCRLPSETEWEYVCRAGTKAEYALPAPHGSDDIAGKGLANCRDCGSEWDYDQTAPVGRFPANTWELQDMHGNVSEWVQDCWHASYHGAPDDGRAWLEEDAGNCSARVVRGGSWSRPRSEARCAYRDALNPTDFQFSNLGFRVLCSSPIF